MEDPAVAKGMVKRDVVQLITPGTKMFDGARSDKQNNYLAAILPSNSTWTIAYIDLSTGELKATTVNRFADVIDELSSLEVKEVVLRKNDEETVAQQIATRLGERGLVISMQTSIEQNATVSFLTQPLSKENESATTAMLLNYIFDTIKHYPFFIYIWRATSLRGEILFSENAVLNPGNDIDAK